jgi:hypothetical protein
VTDKLVAERQAAADAFVAALGRYVDGELADLQQPTDRFVSALSGFTSDAAIASVLHAAAAMVERYWDTASRGDRGAAVAKAMAKPLLDVVLRRLFDAQTPFDRQGELIAAEKVVDELEGRAEDARAALERAVEAGDIESVLSMRAEVEVTIPGRLAQAVEELLKLQLAADQAKLGPARAVRESHAAKVSAAAKAKDDAVELLHRCVQELADAQTSAEITAGTEADVRASIARRTAELQGHRERHARSQQDRIRKLAGLTPAA